MAPQRILLYGVSANPPTGDSGHLGIMKYFSSLFDEVWVLPVYRHIFSSKADLAPFEHRVRMLELCLESCQLNNVHIKLTEKELFDSKLASGLKPTEIHLGTIDIVSYLTSNNSQIDFSLLLGADTYNDLYSGKWKNGDKLLNMVRIVVVSRCGVEVPQPISTNFIQIPGLTDTSSTNIRTTDDEMYLLQELDSKVLEYIKSNQLYAYSK